MKLSHPLSWRLCCCSSALPQFALGPGRDVFPGGSFVATPPHTEPVGLSRIFAFGFYKIPRTWAFSSKYCLAQKIQELGKHFFHIKLPFLCQREIFTSHNALRPQSWQSLVIFAPRAGDSSDLFFQILTQSKQISFKKSNQTLNAPQGEERHRTVTWSYVPSWTQINPWPSHH